MDQTEIQRGLFITFEGIDGCGKSTQVGEVVSWLHDNKVVSADTQIVATREPYDSLGIREVVLKCRDSKVDPRAELMLMMASRAQHVAEVIKPELEKGNWVLCDRYYGSSLAYQGYGRGLGSRIVHQAHMAATGGLFPDLELVIDIPLDESFRRRGNRGHTDKFEAEGSAFAERLIHAYNELARPGFNEYHDYIAMRIDGTESLKQVTEMCGSAIRHFNDWLLSASPPDKT